MFSFLSKINFRRSAKQNSKAGKSSANVAEKQQIFGSPLFNVLVMVALILGVSGFFKILEWRKINAQTQIQFSDSETLSEDEKLKIEKARRYSDIFSGEVFDTSLRLRETGALGFAVCLSILDEAKRQKQIPGSINGLLNAVLSRELMPPGLKIENGEIRSETSVISIRYQPSPLQIEFVSLPQDARFGPALMLRFPLRSADGKNIAYFQSSKVENVQLPKAFAPSHEILRGGGWTLEAWRTAEIGGGNQDFARMLSEEQEQLKKIAPDNSDTLPR
ncbi:MAG: hypothetical protein WA584_02260 [Pyrinomonadaceae bacterium]